MKKIIALLICSAHLFVNGQENGIRWTEGASWAEIVKKAKSENKYIFLDCFATWCGPCHLMDKGVYTNEEVGKAINEKFISVKVQMDKTQYDNELVKKWYNEAKHLQSNYTVTSFPTFLFFNPDGTPLHRAVGYRSPKEFVNLVKDALIPEKQYYALLRSYQPGKIDTSELKGLARALRRSGGELSEKMAIEYLSSIPKSQLENEDNINLMCEYRTSPNMQKFVGDYLSIVPSKKYRDTHYLRLIGSFNSQPKVEELVLNYLEKLNNNDLGKHLLLLQIFKSTVRLPCRDIGKGIDCVKTRAEKIADKYIKSLKPNQFYTKDVLNFLTDFSKTSRDKGFDIFYHNSNRVDEVMEIEGFAMNNVMNILISEEYTAYYEAAVKNGTDNIPWQNISGKISKMYGPKIAQQLDLHIKSSLYEYFAKNKDKYWPEYISSYIQKVERFGTDTSGPMHKFIDATQLNNFVFDGIFYHSTDTNEIKTGLKWMEGVIRRNPREANNIDTYANLLYKAGRVKEAIQWQERAVQLAAEEKQDWVLSSLRGNLVKMKKGEPTWIKKGVNN